MTETSHTQKSQIIQSRSPTMSRTGKYTETESKLVVGKDFSGGSDSKRLPTMQETRLQSVGWEDLEKEMTILEDPKHTLRE